MDAMDSEKRRSIQCDPMGTAENAAHDLVSSG